MLDFLRYAGHSGSAQMSCIGSNVGVAGGLKNWLAGASNSGDFRLNFSKPTVGHDVF